MIINYLFRVSIKIKSIYIENNILNFVIIIASKIIIHIKNKFFYVTKYYVLFPVYIVCCFYFKITKSQIFRIDSTRIGHFVEHTLLALNEDRNNLKCYLRKPISNYFWSKWFCSKWPDLWYIDGVSFWCESLV